MIDIFSGTWLAILHICYKTAYYDPGRSIAIPGCHVPCVGEQDTLQGIFKWRRWTHIPASALADMHREIPMQGIPACMPASTERGTPTPPFTFAGMHMEVPLQGISPRACNRRVGKLHSGNPHPPAFADGKREITWREIPLGAVWGICVQAGNPCLQTPHPTPNFPLLPRYIFGGT